MNKVGIGSFLVVAWLATTGARPAPVEVAHTLETTWRQAELTTIRYSDRADRAPTEIIPLVLPRDLTPRVATKPPRGVLNDETRHWILSSRPAGEVLSLPLPGARESLPVILPDTE